MPNGRLRFRFPQKTKYVLKTETKKFEPLKYPIDEPLKEYVKATGESSSPSIEKAFTELMHAAVRPIARCSISLLIQPCPSAEASTSKCSNGIPT